MSNPIIHKAKMAFLNYQLKRVSIPNFPPSEEIRVHYLFSGKVQKVGFRYQATCIAEKLGLVGWVRNLKNGDVEIEVQGPKEKIDFLIMYLDSRDWFTIESMQDTSQPLRQGELTFEQLKNQS